MFRPSGLFHLNRDSARSRHVPARTDVDVPAMAVVSSPQSRGPHSGYTLEDSTRFAPAGRQRSCICPPPQADPRAAAAALLVPDHLPRLYRRALPETVPRLDADAYVLRHTASGARPCLACNGENRPLPLALRRRQPIPTGVFHILEHSVLCGSASSPSRPFVDLIKELHADVPQP